MTIYIQHKWSNAIHIVRKDFENAASQTYCGKWYLPTQAFTPDISGEREEDVVCSECRHLAAAAAGKKMYSQPTLRRGLSEAKQRKLKPLIKAHQEQQRLAAWNRAAQESFR